jgi:glycosyltransferase involved in cell wall biosynthesis
MKVAIVHELLTMKGGAERVAKIFADMFPDAPIFTLLYDERKLGDWFPASRVRTNEALRSPLAAISNNHHWHLTKFPRVVESWDFSDFDLVLSSSSAFAHGIITNGKPVHISYVHSPARYLWDRTHDVLRASGKGMMGPLKRMYLERVFHTLRMWDSEVADRSDLLIAASKEVQRRIELYWRRESNVVHPPIDDQWFEKKNATRDGEYFLIASTLARYKCIERAIDAANALRVPLKIAGTGPEKSRLQARAGSTVEFLGFTPETELRDLYANAAALIFPGEEDFGLAPLEAMACGTPVIAFGKGGALETIIPGKTGELFTEPTSESLQETIKKFDQKNYSIDALRAHAARFNRKDFECVMREKIETAMRVSIG